MSKKIKSLVSVFFVAVIALSVVAAVSGCKKSGDKADATDADIQYVLYLGTNDKDTVEPVFTPEEAKQKAIEILLKYFGGYTIQEANGGWIDGDKVYTEYTLVIYLSDTTIDKVHTACDEMIEVFHQSSILIQANRTTTEFYVGGNE